NSSALKQLIDSLIAHEPDWTQPPMLTTGPRFFARELKWRDDIIVIPRETFYPYNWNERPTSPRRWTYGSHQWSFSWRPAAHARRGAGYYYRRTRGFVGRIVRQVGKKIVNIARKIVNRISIPQPHAYTASGVICAQTVHGLRIYLSGEDGSVTPEIALTGTYEHAEELFLLRVLRRGDWVIDVGANVGMLSLVCAQKVGSFGRVF